MVMLRVAKHCFFRQRQQVLRPDAARYAASELRMTIAAVFSENKLWQPRQEVNHYQRPTPVAAAPPAYFCSHFSSSSTLILPCQGLLPRPWPSPGNRSKVQGTPRDLSACSSRYCSRMLTRISCEPPTMWVGVVTLLICHRAASWLYMDSASQGRPPR